MYVQHVHFLAASWLCRMPMGPRAPPFDIQLSSFRHGDVIRDPYDENVFTAHVSDVALTSPRASILDIARTAQVSPALGKGTTSVSTVGANVGSTESTLPGTYIGAFPTNGTGNQY